MDSNTLQDLQYTVLGSMLHYPDAIGPAMAQLEQEDFPIPGCQGVYLAIRKLFLAGDPINLLSVTAEAGELPAIPRSEKVIGMTWEREPLSAYSPRSGPGRAYRLLAERLMGGANNG